MADGLGRRTGARPCVLVIEDNPGDYELLRAVVESQAPSHFDLQHVTTLGEAMNELEGDQYQLAIVDLQLPDSIGSQTFDRLRDCFPDLAMVVLTGSEDEDLALRLVQEGAQDFIMKSQLPSDSVARCLEYAIVRMEVENSLRKSREDAAAASQAKSVFLSSMSHEVRTPLNTILGMADLLLETDLTDQQESYVTTFQRCGRGLLGLLNNVLELSRVEAGQVEIHEKELDLREEIYDAVEMFGYTAAKKRIDLAVEVEPGVPGRAVSDPDRLREVIANFVGNAIKFTDEGEIYVHAFRTDGGALRVEVSDTGIGMTEEETKRVFGRFAQANASVRQAYGGSGLGLAICKEIVERMGGEIGVHSEEEAGSVFFFEVPVAWVESTEPRADVDVLPGARVLITDDRELERGILRRMLEAWGAEVTMTSTVGEAVARLEKDVEAGALPDMVVLDARMPDQGGFQLAARLAERPRMVDRVVVMLPMAHRTSDMARARELGVAAVLKPLRAGVLLRALLGQEDPQREAGGSEPPATDLHAVRVLAADDTEDSRTLLAAFISRIGCDLECVEDGLEAVERFRTGEFDVVLMDMNMPRMDGYEATRAIREWEQENDCERTPILALTAYAFREEGRRCIEAGCDAHVPKPFDRQTLEEAIAEHVKPVPREAQERVRVVPDPEIADLVPGYLEGRREDLARMRRAIEEEAFSELARIGHGMKGTGASYGIPKISEIGQRIEQAGNEEDEAGAEALIGELAACLDRIRIVMPADGPSAGEPG